MTIPHNNPIPPVETLPPAEGQGQGSDGGTWGAPVPAAERRNAPWSTRKIIISAAVAVVIVAGGTAAVMAATNGGSTSAAGGGNFPGGFNGGGMGRFGGAAALTEALHGDFVVANGSNGYRTERLQTGSVSAVSSSSLTVKSTDGYTQTYVVDSGTSVDRGADSISKVATGNTVTVIASLSGQTATATTVEDSSLDSSGRFNGGGFPGGGPGGPGGPGN